ncbi:hypothetical protein P171DRAFT_428623 [Karstenula rhodostoma CBS 690.94]|uniref:DUF8021 domain-containing protein n=1 Tax=Karstenula rhodostoma CBS 690.94 TaxID=1392251 RepID=A0A9P4PQJ8_9PLEO|nr:hypothetical protein P171DRAFT_428623 [Karstenula rhodostoma CBS 690.94]
MRLFSLAIVASTASADCTRAFLKTAAADYLAAQISGRPSTFTIHAASNFTYFENNNALSPNSTNSTLTYPLKVDYNYSVYDTVRCATFTEMVAARDPHPFIIHTRIEYGQGDGQAQLLEAIVTDRGDWLFNATTALQYITAEPWPPVAEEKQETREYLQKIGDLYFDRFGNKSVVIPWGLPCYRVEGGLYANGTMNNATGICEQALPSTIIVPYRRYVVDEEAGVVDVFVGFPGLDRTQGKDPMPDGHLIRVEDHKIKFMHTASACVVPGCGEFDPDDPFKDT